jgi:hypothetical protein
VKVNVCTVKVMVTNGDSVADTLDFVLNWLYNGNALVCYNQTRTFSYQSLSVIVVCVCETIYATSTSIYL